MNYYSQSGQDKYFDTKIFKGKRDGFFIEIGAAAGIEGSNTYLFEKEYGWRGICVEPRKSAYHEMTKNRKCQMFNVAVSDKREDEEFYDFSQDWRHHMRSGFSKIFKQKSKQDNLALSALTSVVSVPCVTLNDIIKEHVDLLVIDTEGNELDIIKDSDLSDVDWIDIEKNVPHRTLKRVMYKKGFVYVRRLCADEIYVRKTIAKKFLFTILIGRVLLIDNIRLPFNRLIRKYYDRPKTKIYNWLHKDRTTAY